MEYETTAIAVNWPQHFFVSDLDRDGKSELCLSYWEASSCSLFLFESYDSASLPLRRIWARPCNNTGFAIGGFDTDTDSALEFIWEDGNTGHIYVYECAGDDIYMLRTVLPETLFGYSDYNVCPDLDRDGKPEIFAGWSDMPYVVILETVGNDSFRIVAIESLPLYSYAIVYAVAGGPDIDRDGRTEALVMGVDFHSTGLLAVFESPCNDSFEMIWHAYFPAGFFVYHSLAVGDVDGDSVPEIALTDGRNVRLFRCIGNDQYEQFWQVYNGESQVGVHDINNDGKAEVIAGSDNGQTVIYEYCRVGLAERQLRQLERISISPSIVAKGKAVVINGMPEKANVQVVDVSGRVVAEPERLWNTRMVLPGAYFLRLTKGNQSITRKVLVVE
ncbi:MAG: T9SS type A sorting domain-containing protein [candidate division WOR-3 bacterium]